MAGMEVIGHSELSSATSSVSFSSIPATYQHLYVVGSVRSTHSAYSVGSAITFNDDTGSNYTCSAIFNTGAGVNATEETGRANAPYFMDGAGSSSVANAFAADEMWVLNYASTAMYKSLIGGSSNVGDDAYVDETVWMETIVTGHWESTAAINKVTIASGSSNWAQYTAFTLYGINAA